MIIFSIAVCLFRCILSRVRESQSCSCPIKVSYWVFDKLYNIMILGYFIRSSLEISHFVLISSLNEVYDKNTTTFYRLISFAFSILMILIFVLSIALVLYLAVSSYRIIMNEQRKLEEFFRGLQITKVHKIYTTMLLLRRLIFVILLVTCTFISSRVLIIILAIIQVVYAACLTYLRPYDESKNNIIEILNEIYFFFLILFLAIINTKNEWSSTKTNSYMWVLASNTIITFLIVIIYSLKTPCKYICTKISNCFISRENEVIVLPKQPKTINHQSSRRSVNMIDISHGGSKFMNSENPIEEIKSNLNISDNTPEMIRKLK